ncbi:hypothetical protein [Microcoleus sp.]|uniref:hypothetical protein n=1 Tax=Microcoleus sp. TaxID=44472 RepID=UPI00403EBD43
MKTLVDYLEAGDWLNEFLDHFPSVCDDRAISVLAMISCYASKLNTETGRMPVPQ